MAPQKPVFVIATRNAGKTAEIRDLLQGVPVEIRDLSDFGPIPAVAEDGQTFDENAYQKSSFTARVLVYPALADDSGLEVDALGGEPGPLSRRYAGENASDKGRNDYLLAKLRDVPREKRTARFRGALVRLDIDHTPIVRTWYVVHHSERWLPPAAAAFRDYLLDEGARKVEAETRALLPARRDHVQRSG